MIWSLRGGSLLFSKGFAALRESGLKLRLNLHEGARGLSGWTLQGEMPFLSSQKRMAMLSQAGAPRKKIRTLCEQGSRRSNLRSNLD